MNNYQVKEGDTLSRIALDNKININDILTANPSIESADKIYAGSTIVIPQVSTPVKPVEMPESRVINIEDVQQSQPKMEIPQVENQDTYYTRYLNSLQKDIAPIQTNLAPLYEAEALAMQNLTQKGQETARLQEEAGLSAQQQQLRDLQNQINQQSLKFTAGQYNFSAAGNPITANIARKNDALQLAMLTASASYMQGNILGIQDSIQKAVDLKYNDIETGLYFTQQLITRNENLLSGKQKEQADVKKAIIASELERVEEDKSMIRDLLIKAAQQGADPSILSEASQKNTPEDVARVLGTWAGDYWKIKELKDKYNLDNYGNYGVSTYPVGSLTKESGMTVDDYIKGIAGVESGGEELPYQARGTIVTTGMYKGDRAYGKYQVMGKNIPSWTKEAFGKAMTIEEFLNSPEKQDALIKFRAEKDYAKYGNWDDVASVWFSGKPLKNNVMSDDLGTTVPEYITKFRGFASTSTGNSNMFNALISQATSAQPANTQAKYRSDLQSKIRNGDYKNALISIENATSKNLTGENKTKYDSARIAVRSAEKVKLLLEQYDAAGGDTGLLKGKYETIINKLGNVSDPKYKTIATDLTIALQQYRSDMSGATFSEQEAKDYASVNPSGKNKLDLNVSIIDGMINNLQRKINSTTESQMGEDVIRLRELASGNITTSNSDLVEFKLMNNQLSESNDDYSIFIRSLLNN
mgnify:CR=1 FL=1